ncbi:hypothetical protein [Desulfurobacterium sp.]
MSKYFNYVNLILMIMSPFLFIFLLFKLAHLRSVCIIEKRKIAKMIEEIQNLKSEYNNLQIKYYEILKPETVDNATKKMKYLKENEVLYIE